LKLHETPAEWFTQTQTQATIILNKECPVQTQGTNATDMSQDLLAPCNLEVALQWKDDGF
jgi:hypothetical protein